MVEDCFLSRIRVVWEPEDISNDDIRGIWEPDGNSNNDIRDRQGGAGCAI